ncbi:MAG: crossover junction endodeoxyribonuclease RuvC [Planctomycetota bacterium]
MANGQTGATAVGAAAKTDTAVATGPGRRRSALAAPASEMVIGGIDPGTRRVGYAVLCAGADGWQVLACGSIGCGTGAMADRLGRQLAQLEALFEEHRPAQVGIETTYFGRSAGAAIKMGQGRGVAMAAAARAGARVVELAPRSIKQAVTGFGGATKEQVAQMAVGLLGLAAAPRSRDASDALGCALAVAMLSLGIPIGPAAARSGALVASATGAAAAGATKGGSRGGEKAPTDGGEPLRSEGQESRDGRRRPGRKLRRG